MIDSLLNGLTAFANVTFVTNGLMTALLLALFSNSVMVIVFAYLNFHTRKSHFRLWAASWLCYSMYLAALIGLEQWPEATLLATLGRACVGISALCMLWGSLHWAGRIKRNGGLEVGSILVLIWSFAAPH